MRRSFFVASRVLPSLICFLHIAFAQDFTPPPNWQNTQSDLSRSQRQSMASEAAQKLQSHIDSSGMLPSGTQLTPTLKANMAIVLSSQDLLNGNMTWKSPVTKMLLSYDTGLDWNIDLSYFGLAELSAYLAYNDSTNLANAARNWDIAHTDFVTSAAAQSNSFPRTTNTTSECGTTLGGLIFDLHSDVSNQAVSTRTISSWIAFSSRLAELTQNTTYLDAAKLSIQFARTHLLNPGNVAAPINDSWSVSRCVSSGTPVTWDLGPFIEGLSIVANITQDSSYTQLLLDLVPNAVNTWTSDQGVITEQKGDYRKGTMIRGLLEAKRRNPTNTAMADLIDEYITVQFNAVRKNALISDDNYGTSWIGDSSGSSSSSDYNYAGSAEAMDVLNSAFAIAPNDTVTSGTHHSSIGAIVGGVVGGVVGAIALSLALFFCLRRRRLRAREMPTREEKLDLSTSNEARMVPEPFVNVPSEPFRPPLSKGGSSYPQAGYLSSLNGSDRMGAASSSDLITDLDRTRGADNAAMGSDGSALSSLARRLDNLIDVLAVRGVVEDTPPEYDSRHPASHGPGRS
ncbi:hypothetical protein PENSPDRAFT_646886 [Peniophora sp. CONT]|nr:hypothetical protein PENSPDRAFT_646886 [Peniophora sp. CONT]